MSIITLASCSKDKYEPLYERQNQTGIKNSVKTIDPTISYESPYGTADRFEYVFQNDTDFEWKFVNWYNFVFLDKVKYCQ